MSLLQIVTTVIGIIAVVVVAFFLITRFPSPTRTASPYPPGIQPGPIRHEKLPDSQVARIRKFEPVFAEVYPQTHEAWLEGFQRDIDPEREIAIWEAMAVAYETFTKKRRLSPDAKQEAFGLLLVRSAGDAQSLLSDTKLKHLNVVEAEELLSLYSAAPKPVLLIEKK